MPSLNDIVSEWGLAQSTPYTSYDEAKTALIDGRSQDQIVVDGGLPAFAPNWNESLYGLADVPAVLREATLWLDSQYSEVGEPRVVNQGTGGSVLDAKYGSILGAYVYDGAAVLPGITGNYLTVPDAAALDITGSIEVVVRAPKPNDAATSKTLMSKQINSGDNYSWVFETYSTNLYFIWTTGGTSATQVAPSSSIAALTEGTMYWFKATMDATTGKCRLYWADDQETEPTVWNELTTAAGAGATSIFSGTAALGLGGRSTGGGNPLTGRFKRALIRNGIDGTTVLDVDMTNVEDFATSFTATTGQTVTVNSTTVDTNDPLFLPHTGENYVALPGTTSNYLSVPDAAALDITGDLELVVRLSRPAWTGSTPTLIGKQQTASTRSYYWEINTSGNMVLTVSADGTAVISGTSDAALSFGAGESAWLKATRNATTGAINFYYAADSETEPSAWTQLGTQISATAGSLFASTSMLEIGSRFGGAQNLNGSIYRAMVRNGIDGTTVFDFDAATDITDAGATSFTATSGQTVTVNRATTGRKTALVTRPIWLFGTDDWLEVADNALLDFDADDEFSLVAVYRQWETPSSFYRAIEKLNAGVGYGVINNGTLIGRPYVSVDDGVDEVSTSGTALGAHAAGDLAAYVATLDRTLELLGHNINNVVSATYSTVAVGDISNSGVFRVGAASPTAGNYAAFELVSVAVFRRVLTTEEIAAINNYYGTA